MSETFQFQTIQFNISTLFSSICPIDRTLIGALTSDQNRPRSDDNKVVLHIPQSSSITEASLSDCLVSYQRYSLGESYPSAEMQSMYTSVPADWAKIIWLLHQQVRIIRNTYNSLTLVPGI